MKRKRGRKHGKKSTSRASTESASPTSPSSPSTEENSPADQEENAAPATSPPVPLPPPSEPEKPNVPPATRVDIPYAKPKVGAVYGRVKLKFKSSKVLEPHQTSSDAQTSADAGKSASVAPEVSKQIAVEKATVVLDGQTDGQPSELSGSDKDRELRKVATIKIKSTGLSSVEDNTNDRKADPVDEPLPSKQHTVLENEESENALEPSNSQELEVKQSTPERQCDDKELASALEAIKKVMKMDAADPFNVPVDPVALGIPDYFDIIDTPMDFGTICQDLERGNKYMNSEDVFKDVQFIWDNCTKYNSKGDYIIELMKRVKKAFMKNWLAAGLYSDVQENGGNENTGDEDAKGNSKSKSKNKRRRLGNDRHKNDCACAVCQVTRRKKERDEILAVDNETAVMNSYISDLHNMEVNSVVNNPGSHDTASSQEQPPQTDVYKETMEADDREIQMETLGKFLNNRTSNFQPSDYEDEDSRQYSEEKEEVEYKDMNSHEEHNSTQPNDDPAVVDHHEKAQAETSQEVEMEDYPVQQENHSFLQLCARLFPSNQSSVSRGRHSLFCQQRQVSLKESPLHAAMTAMMKP